MNILSNPSYLITPLVAFAIGMLLAILVLCRDHRSATHRVFSLMLLSTALWGIFIFAMRASPDTQHALFWDKAMVVPGIGLTVFYYHFTSLYTKMTSRRLLWGAYVFLLLVSILTGMGFVVRGMTVESYGYAPLFYPTIYVISVGGIFFLVMGLVNLIRAFRATTRPQYKTQLTYMMIAIVFPVVGGLMDVFPEPPPAGILGNVLFGLVSAIAILKYHLLDVSVIIRKGLVYLLISLLVALPYVGILYWLSQILKTTLELWWVHAITILLLAIVLRPLYSWAQRLVDKLFYRDRYNYFSALERFSQETQSIADLEELGSNVIRLVSGALRSSNACLLLPSKNNDGWTVVSCVGLDNPPSGVVITRQSLLVKWLKLHGRILSSRELDIIPKLQSLSSIEKQNLAKLRAELYTPIRISEGELSGILILGEKLGQQAYSTQDLQVLVALSGQIAMALENARLYSGALQARENLETWLNSMTDCVIIISSDFTIQFVNRAAMQKFGCRAGEKCWDAIGKDTVCPSCPMQNYVGGNRDGLQFRENIGDRVYDIAAAPLLSPDGSLCIIEVLRDITERKQVEEERQRIERLESVGILAGGIAHDFNNLLTGITGNIGLAKRHVEPRSKAEARLLEAEKASLRAKDLTQQLLTFARGGAPIKEAASVAELIKDSVAFALSGSNVRSRLSLPDDLWSVEFDQGQMAQVINNLVINADKAMPDGGALNVKAQNALIDEKSTLPLKKGKYVEIIVEDQGIGISKEHLSRIFEPYFTTKQKGSGLGLATTYSIIKNHDGYITAESKLGVGTTFYIYLPASDKPILAKRGEEAETHLAGRGRVLVMDDEEVIRELLYQELTDVSYEVELTIDGAEAIKRYKKAKESGQPFDAVILDLTVPGGLGGKEVIKKMLEIDPGVKAIVSSGYSTDPIMSEFRDYGFSGVVAKPYKMEQLEKILRSIITKIDE